MATISARRPLLGLFIICISVMFCCRPTVCEQINDDDDDDDKRVMELPTSSENFAIIAKMIRTAGLLYSQISKNLQFPGSVHQSPHRLGCNLAWRSRRQISLSTVQKGRNVSLRNVSPVAGEKPQNQFLNNLDTGICSGENLPAVNR